MEIMSSVRTHFMRCTSGERDEKVVWQAVGYVKDIYVLQAVPGTAETLTALVLLKRDIHMCA